MVRDITAKNEKPLIWVGSSLKDLLKFPADVQLHLGFAIGQAQMGGKHPDAKPWNGDGPGVFEVVEDHRGDTFRAVYTVRFEGIVYGLHVFQKKSTHGIKTSKADQDLIAARLRTAQRDYKVRYGKNR